MHLDASAIVAMITRETDHVELAASLARSRVRTASAVGLYEATLGIARKLDWTPLEARRLVEAFLALADVQVLAIDRPIWVAAVEAFELFGKGRHPAALNMGDCFAYACARIRGEPLLFTDDDFGRTDIAVA